MQKFVSKHKVSWWNAKLCTENFLFHGAMQNFQKQNIVMLSPAKVSLQSFLCNSMQNYNFSSLLLSIAIFAHAFFWGGTQLLWVKFSFLGNAKLLKAKVFNLIRKLIISISSALAHIRFETFRKNFANKHKVIITSFVFVLKSFAICPSLILHSLT